MDHKTSLILDANMMMKNSYHILTYGLEHNSVGAINGFF